MVSLLQNESMTEANALIAINLLCPSILEIVRIAASYLRKSV